MDKSRVIFYTLVLAFLGCLFYFYKNADSIYGNIGDFYYKKNNILKAQEYYEKALTLGNNDTNLREMYVNLLINSPLTLDSQEKLVRIAESGIADGASVRAKTFLYDLMREIHNKYPLNYIKQAAYNQKIIRWSKFPITYTYKNTSGVPKEFLTEINNAFLTWEKLGTVMFSKVENVKDANIVIEFKTGDSKDTPYGTKYVIAYTTPIVYVNELRGMNIKFYTNSPDGNMFTQNQIYNTALHEIFHALGFMGHSFDKNNIMYLSSDSSIYSNNQRETLTEADTTTLELLYKIKPDITNAGDLEGEYIPYLILGDDKDVNYFKSKEAQNYIRQAPMLPGGYIDLAESYVAQKKYPEAIKALEKALTLADTDDIKFIVYYNLAVSYFYIHHLDLSKDYIKRALELKDTEELHYLTAEIYKADEDFTNAIKEYAYLTKKNPQNIDYAINLANIYIKKSDYINARKVLKNYIKNNPKEKNNKRLSAFKILMF